MISLETEKMFFSMYAALVEDLLAFFYSQRKAAALEKGERERERETGRFGATDYREHTHEIFQIQNYCEQAHRRMRRRWTCIWRSRVRVPSEMK